MDLTLHQLRDEFEGLFELPIWMSLTSTGLLPLKNMSPLTKEGKGLDILTRELRHSMLPGPLPD